MAPSKWKKATLKREQCLHLTHLNCIKGAKSLLNLSPFIFQPVSFSLTNLPSTAFTARHSFLSLSPYPHSIFLCALKVSVFLTLPHSASRRQCVHYIQRGVRKPPETSSAGSGSYSSLFAQCQALNSGSNVYWSRLKRISSEETYVIYVWERDKGCCYRTEPALLCVWAYL